MFQRDRRLDKPRALLPSCGPLQGKLWVDVGCGDGVFTEGLLELTPLGTTVIGFDRDPTQLFRLAAWAGSTGRESAVYTVQGDFRHPLPFVELAGALAANALHFVPEAEKTAVLQHLRHAIRPGGRLIVVEYNTSGGNPAVPYPKSASEWLESIRAAGFPDVAVAAAAPSSFLGEMVALSAVRPS